MVILRLMQPPSREICPPTAASILPQARKRGLQVPTAHADADPEHSHARNTIGRKRTSAPSNLSGGPWTPDAPSLHSRNSSPIGASAPGMRRDARTRRMYGRRTQASATGRASKYGNHGRGASQAARSATPEGDGRELHFDGRTGYAYVVETGVSRFHPNGGAQPAAGVAVTQGRQPHAETRTPHHLQWTATQSWRISGLSDGPERVMRTSAAHRTDPVVVRGFSDPGISGGFRSTLASTDTTGGHAGRVTVTTLSSALAKGGSDLVQLTEGSAFRHRHRHVGSHKVTSRGAVKLHRKKKCVVRSTVAIYAFLCLMGFLRLFRGPSQLRISAAGIEGVGAARGRGEAAHPLVLHKSENPAVDRHNQLDTFEGDLSQAAGLSPGESLTDVDDSSTRNGERAEGTGSSDSSVSAARVSQESLRTPPATEALPSPPVVFTEEAEAADSYGVNLERHLRLHSVFREMEDGAPTPIHPVNSPPEPQNIETSISTASAGPHDQPYDSERQALPVAVHSATRARRAGSPGKGRRDRGRSPHGRWKHTARGHDGAPGDSRDAGVGSVEERDTMAERVDTMPHVARSGWPCGSGNTGSSGFQGEAIAVDQSVALLPEPMEVAAVEVGKTRGRKTSTTAAQKRARYKNGGNGAALTHGRVSSASRRPTNMRSPSSTARSESVASAQTAHETLGGSGEPGADREVGQSRATPFFSPDLPVSERTTPADSAGRKPATGSQAVKPLGTDGKALSTGHRVLQDSSGQVGEDGIPGRAVPDTPRSGDMQTNTVDAWTVGRGSTERSNLVTESQRETLAGSPVGPLPSGRESSATSPVTNDSTEEVATVYMQAGRSTDRSTVPDVDSSLVPDEEVKKEANTPMPQHPRILPLKVKGAPLLTDKTEAAAKLPQKRSEEVPSGGAPLGAGAAVAAGAAAVFAGSPGFAYAFPGPLASEDGKVAEMIFFSGKQFEQEHRTTDLVGKRQAGYRSQPSAAMWVGPFERKAPEKPEEHPLSQEAGVDIIEAGSMEGLPMKHPIDATYGVEGTETGNVEWTPMKKREHKTPSASYVPATGRAFLHASEMGVTGAGQKGDPDGILAHLANGEDARGVEKSIGHSGRLPFDAIDVYPALMQDAPPRRSGFFGAQQGIDRSTPPPNFPDGVWGADGAKYLIQQALTEDLKSLPSKPRSSESLDSELRFMFGLQWLGEAGEEVRGRRKAQGKVRSRRDLRKHFKTMQHLLSDIHVKLGSYEKAGLVPPTAPFKQLYEFLASMYKEMKRIDASLTPGATASGQTLDAGSSTADKPEHGLLPGSASTSLPSAVVSAIGAQHGNLFFRQQPGESGSSVFAGFGGRDPRRRRLTDKHGRQLIDEAYETASNMVFLLTKLRADLQVYAVENQMCALMHGNGECGAGGKRRGPPASSKELVASHRRLMTRILDNLAAGAKAVSKRRLHANAVIQRVAATASEEFRSMARKYMLVLEGLHVRYVLQMQLYRNKLEMGPVYFPPDDPYPSLLPSPQYKDTKYGDTGDEDTIHLPYRRKRINSVSSIEDDLSNEFLESSWRRTISESVQGSPRSDGLWLEKDRRNAVYHISNKRLSASIHTATLASLNEYQSIQRKIGEFSGMQGAFFFPGHVTEHVFLKDGFWTGADASVGNAL